jgi:hypothetical protein
MKLIHYAGDELVTGDSIADAVLRYAAALAETEGSLALDIPVQFPDGRVAAATMLIGPASQLVAVPHDTEFDEIVDDELVAKIEASILALSNAHPQTVSAKAADTWEQPADWEL